MNPVIRINIDNFKKVLWTIILLGVARYYEWFSTNQIALVYVALLIIVIGFMKKIIVPNIWGLKLYLFFIVYSSVVGFLLYRTRSVVRDMYYVIPTVVLVILGYYIYCIYSKTKSIERTIVMLGTIFATLNFISMIKSPSSMSEFTTIRKTFSAGGYEILIAFLVLFLVMFIKKKRIFGKWFERYSFCIMLLDLLLTLARSVWIEAIIGCFVIIIVNAYFKHEFHSMITMLAKIVVISVIGIVVFFNFAPAEVTEEFTDKFAKSTEELDSKQEFDSTNDAINNWRAYEIQSAQKQWKESNVAVEIFGAGMGKGIALGFVPYTWKGMVENGEIPLLHNAYYTILPKGGLVGVIALIWFMFANIVTAFKVFKRKSNMKEELVLLVSISVVFLVQSYTVRGPVVQSANLSWALLIGWINAQIHYSEDSMAVAERK